MTNPERTRQIAMLAAGEPDQQCDAAEALGAGEPDEASIAALARALELRCWKTVWYGNTPWYTPVAKVAAEALARCGAAAVPALTHALACRDHFELPVPCEDQGVYIGDYTSEPIHVAALAAGALSKIGAPAAGAIAALVDASYGGAAVSEACRTAVLAIGAAAPSAPGLSAALLQLSRIDDREARYRFAQGLLKIGPPAVAAALALIEDTVAFVRQYASATLVKAAATDPSVVPALIALQARARPEVEAAVSDALAKIRATHQ